MNQLNRDLNFTIKNLNHLKPSFWINSFWVRLKCFLWVIRLHNLSQNNVKYISIQVGSWYNTTKSSKCWSPSNLTCPNSWSPSNFWTWHWSWCETTLITIFFIISRRMLWYQVSKNLLRSAKLYRIRLDSMILLGLIYLKSTVKSASRPNFSLSDRLSRPKLIKLAPNVYIFVCSWVVGWPWGNFGQQKEVLLSCHRRQPAEQFITMGQFLERNDSETPRGEERRKEGREYSLAT